MPTSTSFTCPDCDERRTVVVSNAAESASFDCPNCGESIAVAFTTD